MLPVLSRRVPAGRRRVLGQLARGFKEKPRKSPPDRRLRSASASGALGDRLGSGRLRLLRADRLCVSQLGVLQSFQLGGGRVESDVVAVGGQAAVAQWWRSFACVGGSLGSLARFGLQGGAPFGGEEPVHPVGELEIEPLDLRDLLRTGGADPAERAEVREQRALALLADARDLLQQAAEVPFAPLLAMVGDRKPVRFVAQPRQEEQLAGVLPQDDRVLLPGKEDALGAALDLVLDEAALPARAAGGPGRVRG